MFGLGKPKPVKEIEAEGETERVYHEIKQVMRVTGVNLNFRAWAGYEKLFPVMWDAVRPNAETRRFEDAADRLRAEAARAAEKFGKLNAATSLRLGESQSYQIRRALDLYHYINPKLLLLTATVSLALDGGRTGGETGSVELIERGAPARMYPMEMVAEEPEDARLRELFDDIKKTLSLSSINSDYRTLALWPDYLASGWQRLKPITGSEEYKQASEQLRLTARELARGLPYRVPLSRGRVEELGEDANEIIETTGKFERILPSLIINVALFALDGRTPDTLVQSPFPAAARHDAGIGQGGAR
ncbi:MAG: halocarboxylic acid dehydrogenase DehI family protein [Acidobacteriota bacterium]|nr:halocarboxylic acid dehydrogenase DehI family protein [Acidobacteriota bacterium]